MLIIHNYILLSALSLLFGILISLVLTIPVHLLFFSLLILLILIWFSRGRPLFNASYFLFVFIVGFGLAKWDQPDARFPFEKYENKRVWVYGVVKSFPETRKAGKRKITKFQLSVDRLELYHRRIDFSGRLLVSLFNHDQTIAYGDSLKIVGEIVEPKEGRNMGQFNYRDYLRAQKISGLFYGFGKGCVNKLRGPTGLVDVTLSQVTRVRELLRDAIERDFSETTIRGIVLALTLGERGSIPDHIREAFVRTGTIHLLAISGLHISILCVFFFTVCRLMGLPSWTRVVITLALINSYALISGYQTPVVRASIMATLALFSGVFKRDRSFLSAVSLAFIICLAGNANLVRLPGFQLSFLAVFSIVFFTPLFETDPNPAQAPSGHFYIKRSILRYGQNLIASTTAALVGTLPVIAWHFNLVSTVDVMANLFAIPLMTCVLALNVCFVVSCFLPGIFIREVLAQGISASLNLLIGSNQTLSQLPFAAVSLASPPIILISMYYAGLMGFCFLVTRHKNLKATRLALSLFFAIFLFLFTIGPSQGFFREPVSRLTMALFDLRGREAVYIGFPEGQKWLLNAGSGHPADDARWALIPFFRAQAIQRLDGLVLSSYRSRHLGGFRQIQESLHPREIYFPKQDKAFAQFSRKEPMMKFLHKQAAFYKRGAKIFSQEAYSVDWFVSREGREGEDAQYILRYGNTRIYFGLEAFKSSDRIKGGFSQEVLVLSTLSWPADEPSLLSLNRTSLKYVIFLGEPSREVVRVLHQNGISFLTTEDCGMVRLVSDGERVEVRRWL